MIDIGTSLHSQYSRLTVKASSWGDETFLGGHKDEKDDAGSRFEPVRTFYFIEV